jgi:glycosyltransferase involved in cell wall biosynthesis
VAKDVRSSRVPPGSQLRVAILAPISWRVPPRHYGPWEQFTSLLTEGLVERGVDVTLFATADSITTAHLVGTAPTGYSEDPGLHAKAWEALHISAAFERAGEFDLIHNSFDFLPLTYSGLVDTPVVTTIHGFSSEQIVPVFEKYNGLGYYVAISDSDRHGQLDYIATIHHGIDFGKFQLRQEPGDYLLFFGRIHPDKGTVEAIDVAERAGVPLVIAGIVQDRGYFERLVEPRLDGEQVTYVGAVGPDRRGDLLGGARALLHLVNFDEPFGFSVVEAMACGTPVVARRRGSMREIVYDAEGGFLVDTLDQAVAAVHAASAVDRTAVRASVERRFGVDRMVDDYLALYRRIVELDRVEHVAQRAVR